MKNENRWFLDDEDFIRAKKLYPLFRDEPAICIVEDLNSKSSIQFNCGANYNSENALSLHGVEGLACQVLKFGSKQWVTGKVRYVLEFEPDNPAEMLEVKTSLQIYESIESIESKPIDEIRKLGEEP